MSALSNVCMSHSSTMGAFFKPKLTLKHTFLEFIDEATHEALRARALTDSVLALRSESDGEFDASQEVDAAVKPSKKVSKSNTRWSDELGDDGLSSDSDQSTTATASARALTAESEESEVEDVELAADAAVAWSQYTGMPWASPCYFNWISQVSAVQMMSCAAGWDQQADNRTTVMLRNLPNDYTRVMLLELIDAEGFCGRYDFVYLPIDFSSQAGLGYAFVNLVSPADAAQFWQHFEGFSRWSVPSQKVCEVNWSAPQQGLAEHLERYRNSPVMHEGVPDEFKPVLFMNGRRVAFPLPTRKLKAPRIRMGACKGRAADSPQC